MFFKLFVQQVYMDYFFQEPWSKAKYLCKWLGMDLVSIETEEENKAIVAALGNCIIL
jgi:hypothetical protein